MLEFLFLIKLQASHLQLYSEKDFETGENVAKCLRKLNFIEHFVDASNYFSFTAISSSRIFTTYYKIRM